MRNLGKYIRAIRQQKGIGLNAMAVKLDVSPAYLSNLENGKTESVSLSFLEKVNSDLQINLFYMSEFHKQTELNNEFNFRLNRSTQQLLFLHEDNHFAADYLLGNLEYGLEFFQSKPLSKNVN